MTLLSSIPTGRLVVVALLAVVRLPRSFAVCAECYVPPGNQTSTFHLHSGKRTIWSDITSVCLDEAGDKAGVSRCHRRFDEILVHPRSHSLVITADEGIVLVQ